MGRKTTSKASPINSRSFPPAQTPEQREKQLISLATDLVEQRLRDGTASSAETVHFLKLASAKDRLERQKLETEVEMIKAKTKAIVSSEEISKLYAEAYDAFRGYQGSVLGKDDE